MAVLILFVGFLVATPIVVCVASHVLYDRQQEREREKTDQSVTR